MPQTSGGDATNRPAARRLLWQLLRAMACRDQHLRQERFQQVHMSIVQPSKIMFTTVWLRLCQGKRVAIQSSTCSRVNAKQSQQRTLRLRPPPVGCPSSRYIGSACGFLMMIGACTAAANMLSDEVLY